MKRISCEYMKQDLQVVQDEFDFELDCMRVLES